MKALTLTADQARALRADDTPDGPAGIEIPGHGLRAGQRAWVREPWAIVRGVLVFGADFLPGERTPKMEPAGKMPFRLSRMSAIANDMGRVSMATRFGQK